MNKSKIDKRILDKLNLPKPGSHKGQNGRLLVVAGSKKYHGSLLYAIKTAAKIVDLVYVLKTKENRGLVEKLKSGTAEFIPVNPSWSARWRTTLPSSGEGNKVDCILIGPGMGKSKRTYKLVEKVLKSGIRAVLDADALNVMDAKLLKLLGPRHILTPHRGEFERMYQKLTNVRKWHKMNEREREENFVKQFGCTVVLKGKVDIVSSPSPSPLPSRERKILIAYNQTGNEGMTKGGTGDVLAGLIAGFYCRNNAFVSAAAGAYINGLAGDELYKKVGPYYNAEDLVEQIPMTLWRLRRRATSPGLRPPSPGLGRDEGRGRTFIQ